jgi:hypothetical protein
MKKCKRVTGWTDYPFDELGDVPGQLAPIRHVKVVGYDGNKYVKVELLDEDEPSYYVWESLGRPPLEIKAGYLYRKCMRMPNIPYDLKTSNGRQNLFLRARRNINVSSRKLAWAFGHHKWWLRSEREDKARRERDHKGYADNYWSWVRYRNYKALNEGKTIGRPVKWPAHLVLDLADDMPDPVLAIAGPLMGA